MTHRKTNQMHIKAQTPNEATAQNFYCFIDRSVARVPDFFLPKAPGVLVMETDFLKAEVPLWLDYPVGWTLVDRNRGKSRDGKLEVAQLGEFWFIGRRTDPYSHVSETVVEAFGEVPVCTRTCQDAMMLAERCHPEVALPIGACWIRFEDR
jgi:hypothetical protein